MTNRFLPDEVVHGSKSPVPEAGPPSGPWSRPSAGDAIGPAPHEALPTTPPLEPHILRTDFRSAIRKNIRNSALLLALLVFMCGLLGYVGGWVLEVTTALSAMKTDAEVSAYEHGLVRNFFTVLSPLGVFLAFILCALAGFWSLLTVFWGGRMLLALTSATPADPQQHQVLFNVVEEMAIAASLPVPAVYIIEGDGLNAFAAGTSPSNAAIAVTQGMLRNFDREQLQSVVGHEMGHILNRDVLYGTIVAIGVGIIAFVAEHVSRFGFRTSSYASSSDSKKSGAGAIALIIVLFSLFALALSFLAKFVELAISRQREYLADATSTRLTRNPVGMIRALEGLRTADTNFPTSDSPVAALCLTRPSAHSLVEGLFSTHPPLEDRIARLRDLH